MTGQTMLELMAERHSTREYTGETVKREDLEKITEAGRLSPSARNSQPWKFYVAESPAAVKDTAAAIALCGRNAFTAKCGAFIAVCDHPIPEDRRTVHRCFEDFDVGMAVMQMCLEAHSLGIASCILGLYNEEGVKCALGIPEDKNVRLVIALGISAEQSVRKKDRREPDDVTEYR